MKIETIEKIWKFEKKIEIFTAGVKNFENWENLKKFENLKNFEKFIILINYS